MAMGLLKMLIDLIERSRDPIHCPPIYYATRAMRHTHRIRNNKITKGLLKHVGPFNLSLVMCHFTGIAKPLRLKGFTTSIFDSI